MIFLDQFDCNNWVDVLGEKLFEWFKCFVGSEADFIDISILSKNI